MNKQQTRKPVVAGMFYPGEKETLEENLNGYFNNAELSSFSFRKIHGIISPHAGYPYSGPVAAYGFKLLKKIDIKNIIVVAPSHREYFSGFSIYPGKYFETPLGNIAIGTKTCDLFVEAIDSIKYTETGHRDEHSLEVQLPFLQTIYPNGFNLIPVVMGDCSLQDIDDFANTMAGMAKDEDFIIIASSDLSHFHPYNKAVKTDNNLISILQKFDIDKLEIGYQNRSLEACGLGPILLLMKYAKFVGVPLFKKLNYKNSGDTSGMMDQVVGYLSAVIYE